MTEALWGSEMASSGSVSGLGKVDAVDLRYVKHGVAFENSAFFDAMMTGTVEFVQAMFVEQRITHRDLTEAAADRDWHSGARIRWFCQHVTAVGELAWLRKKMFVTRNGLEKLVTRYGTHRRS